MELNRKQLIILHIGLFILMICQWSTIIFDMGRIPNYIFKPQVVFYMFVFTLLINNKGAIAFQRFMVIAFFFSMMGDIFLMLPDQDAYFLLGLGSFATSHLAFIIGFFSTSSFDQELFLNFSLPLAVLLVGYDVFIYSFLTMQSGFPNDKKVPVLIYITLISTMIFAASMRDKTSTKSYVIGIIGAFLFITSDSLLSLNLFAEFSSKGVRLLIMITYYLAEEFFFISTLLHYDYTQSVLKRLSNESESNKESEELNEKLSD